MMLAITALNAHYGDSHVLRGVGLTLASGSALGLLGRNGMGKTTLIRTLMGYVRATGGQVQWDGREVTGWAPERMRASASATCLKAAASSATSACARTW
jgi:branched-chain amino acid transport system ATP-binding protein